MNRRLVQAYHRLPPWARSVAASAEGVRLNWWRWSSSSEDLAAEAIERESWSAERWRGWQLEELAERLDRAARRVPYYRAQWSHRRQRGDRSSWERLENWPLLEKDDVRRAGKALVSESVLDRPLRLEQTSGTTGTPTRLWRSRDTLVRRYALYEARHRRWYGVSRRDRWAMAACQPVVSREADHPPYWVWNAAMRQLYVSSYHLAPGQARASYVAIRDYRCRYAWGYPSSLALLAQAGVVSPSQTDLKCVVTNAEPLLPSQRAVIERAFACRVYETYGMVELVAAAGECSHGAMHWFPEFGYIELLDEFGGGAEIVATSLLDSDMPLIRYRTGDSAVPGESLGPCGCGRGLPRVGAIEGRTEDSLYSVDGRPVMRLDPVFKGDLPIREAQVVQESLDDVTVVVAPAEEWTSRCEQELTTGLRERLGDIRVRFELVSSVPRGPNGKFRSLVCRIPSPAVRTAAASR